MIIFRRQTGSGCDTQKTTTSLYYWIIPDSSKCPLIWRFLNEVLTVFLLWLFVLMVLEGSVGELWSGFALVPVILIICKMFFWRPMFYLKPRFQYFGWSRFQIIKYSSVSTSSVVGCALMTWAMFWRGMDRLKGVCLRSSLIFNYFGYLIVICNPVDQVRVHVSWMAVGSV